MFVAYRKINLLIKGSIDGQRFSLSILTCLNTCTYNLHNIQMGNYNFYICVITLTIVYRTHVLKPKVHVPMLCFLSFFLQGGMSEFYKNHDCNVALLLSFVKFIEIEVLKKEEMNNQRNQKNRYCFRDRCDV